MVNWLFIYPSRFETSYAGSSWWHCGLIPTWKLRGCKISVNRDIIDIFLVAILLIVTSIVYLITSPFTVQNSALHFLLLICHEYNRDYDYLTFRATIYTVTLNLIAVAQNSYPNVLLGFGTTIGAAQEIREEYVILSFRHHRCAGESQIQGIKDLYTISSSSHKDFVIDQSYVEVVMVTI